MPAATSETPLWKPSRQKCSSFQMQGQLEADLTISSPGLPLPSRWELTKRRSRVIRGYRNNRLSSYVIINLNAPELRGDEGGLWENFLITERLKRSHNQRLFPSCYFRRSHQKQEIDYREDRNGALRGYEIKWRATR